MSEKKDKIRAILGAFVFHLLLLIALVFLALTTPLPLPEEEGVEVNLGYSDMGSGYEQRQQPQEQIKPPAPVPVQEAASQPEDEIVEDQSEDAPAIQEKAVEKPEKQKAGGPKESTEEILQK